MTIDKGQKNARLLVQPQYSPVPVEEQIALLYCGTKGLLGDVPLNKVDEFEAGLIRNLRQAGALDTLKETGIDKEVAENIEEVAKGLISVLLQK